MVSSFDQNDADPGTKGPPPKPRTPRPRAKRVAHHARRLNQELHAAIGKLHNRFVVSSAVAMLLVALLGLVALQPAGLGDGAAVNLGTGMAGLKTDTLAADTLEVPTEEPPVAVSPAEAEDVPTEPSRTRTGEASYYGYELAGQPTASGEAFDPEGLTAAHRTLPMGTRVRVTNLRNDASVVVRINDRGPFVGNRVIDLSRRAAEQIGMLQRGHALVQMEVLD